MLRGMPLIWVLHLHSNMFLLILIWNEWFRDENLHLHSNMFLLIQEIPTTLKLSVFVFTFQYVSINTLQKHGCFLTIRYLHSNMFLLIRFWEVISELYLPNLHSNMFLLIQSGWSDFRWFLRHLHSNMFLLILCLTISAFRSIRHLHSNMFLLIR